MSVSVYSPHAQDSICRSWPLAASGKPAVACKQNTIAAGAAEKLLREVSVMCDATSRYTRVKTVFYENAKRAESAPSYPTSAPQE